MLCFSVYGEIHPLKESIANHNRVKIIWVFTMVNFITHMGGKDIYKYLETEDILDFGKLFAKFQSFRSEMSSPQLSF